MLSTRVIIIAYLVYTSCGGTLGFDHTSFYGNVEVYQGDSFEHGTSSTYAVFSNLTENIKVKLELDNEKLDSLNTGMHVRIRGYMHKEENIEAPGKEFRSFNVEELEILDSIDVESPLKKRDEDDLGASVRRLVVIIVNFLDESVYCSPEFIENLVWGKSSDKDFQSIRRSYEANSFGRTTFVKSNDSDVEVFGPYTIPVYLRAETRCRPEEWSNMAMDIAKSSGVDFRKYKHYMFVLPESSFMQQRLCGWNGLGHLNCLFKCKTWVANCDSLGVYIHELGHNLGLRHSGLYDPTTNGIIEYGDPTAIMGNRWWNDDPQNVYYFNALHRIELGWITEAHVVSATDTGVYRVTPYNQPPIDGKYQALKIVAPGDIGKSPTPFYLFSYVSGEHVVFNETCVLHRFLGTARPSVLLEMLSVDGISIWRDPTDRFSVELLSINEKEMVLRVDFLCVTFPTKISVLAGQNYHLPPENLVYLPAVDLSSRTIYDKRQSIFLGSSNTLNLTVSLFNQDTAPCLPTNFEYTINQIEGWSFICSPSSIYLVPQQSCNLQCNVSWDDTSVELYHKSVDVLVSYGGDNRGSFYLGLLGSQICWRVNLSILESPTLIEVIQGETMTFSLSIKNEDSISCEPRSIIIESHFDIDGLKVELEKTEIITINPQDTYVHEFVSNVPENLGLWTYSIRIIDESIIDSSNHFLTEDKRVHTQLIPARIRAQCKRLPFGLVMPINDVSIKVRNGSRLLLQIANRDSDACLPETLSIDIRSNNPLVQPRVYPSQVISMKPQQETEAYITIAIGDKVDTYQNTTLDVVVYGNNHHEKISKVLVHVEGDNCIQNMPSFSVYCPSYVGIINTDSVGYFSCQVYWENHNDLPCTDSYYKVSANFIIDGELESIFSEQFEFPEEWVIPGNTTIQAMHVNFDASKVIEVLEDGELLLSINFTLNDIYLPLHLTSNAEVQIGQCIRMAPIFSLGDICSGEDCDDEDTSDLISPTTGTLDGPVYVLYSGATILIPLTIENVDGPFCNISEYSVAIVPSRFNPFVNATVASSISVENIQKVWIRITSTIEAEGQHNFTIRIVHSMDSTIKASVNMSLLIDTACQIQPPTLDQLKQHNLTLREDSEVLIPMIIRNEDSEDCPESTFNFIIYILTNHLSLSTDLPSPLTLQPQEAFEFNVSFVTSKYLNPGNYTTILDINDLNQIAHTIQHSMYIGIQCPIPRPVSNIQMKEVGTPLGASMRIELTWKACETQSDCCCPCTYEIYNRGSLIGTSLQKTFTYSPSLSEVGMKNQFEIHVRDVNNQTSPINTCGFRSETLVTSSPFDFFIIFLYIILVLALPVTALVIEFKRNKEYSRLEEE